MWSSMVDIKTIRMVYDMIKSNVRSLQNLGISAEVYGSLLIPIMLAEIPEELKLIISRNMKEQTWDVEQPLAIFKCELEAREKILSMSGSSSMIHVEGKFNRKVCMCQLRQLSAVYNVNSSIGLISASW